MHTAALVRFLSQLKKNNNKEWFEKNRDRYTELRSEFFDLTAAVLMSMVEFDPSLASVEPKHCIFRINRDVRFSKDKSPYKTQFASAISPEGKGGMVPMYYFHIDHQGELIIAGGVYDPDGDTLKKIRNFIAAHPEKIEKIIKNKKIMGRFNEIWGEQLVRLPKGFDESVRYPELIRKKRFILEEDIKVSGLSDDKLFSRLHDNFKLMYPFIEWLREGIKQ